MKPKGTFSHKLTLYGAADNGSQRPSITVDALVDTGALFSAIPTRMLEDLGIKPTRRVPVRFANGQVEQWSMAGVEAELNGVRMPILCLFGAADAPPILGAHALEAFLLMVDPVEMKLVPREAFLM